MKRIVKAVKDVSRDIKRSVVKEASFFYAKIRNKFLYPAKSNKQQLTSFNTLFPDIKHEYVKTPRGWEHKSVKNRKNKKVKQENIT